MYSDGARAYPPPELGAGTVGPLPGVLGGYSGIGQGVAQ